MCLVTVRCLFMLGDLQKGGWMLESAESIWRGMLESTRRDVVETCKRAEVGGLSRLLRWMMA